MISNFSRFLLLILVLSSCTKSFDHLQDYINNFDAASDALVSCAASNGEDLSKSVIFYRSIPNSSNIQLWHSETYSQDLTNYSLVEDVTVESLFNGFMGKLEENINHGAVIVSFDVSDTVVYCKPIELLNQNQATVRNESITIDQTELLEPNFQWTNSTIDPNSIYFQLIVNTDSNLAVSGTYTYENQFQFYNLSNVVFNVTEEPNPMLKGNSNYQITLMQVSDNNWVHTISTKSFNTF